MAARSSRRTHSDLVLVQPYALKPGNGLLRILVVSPHRDDAAFSCAIAIRWFINVAEVSVANVFTISEYAPFRTAEPGLISDLRLQEDASYALLSRVTLQDLDLVDAPQRLKIEVSQICAARPLDMQDERVSSEIVAHIAGLAPDLLLAPLALGDHIDHRIARHAAIRSGAAALCFYEDLPYAARLPREAPLQQADGVGVPLQPHIVSGPGGAEWKAICAALYKSQIDLNTVREIADFSLRYGEGDRLWVTPQASEILASFSIPPQSASRDSNSQ